MSASILVRRAVPALASAVLVLVVAAGAARATDYQGTNGKFTTSVTTEGFTGEKTIHITYYPDPAKVRNCSAIYIVQTVRRIDQDGHVIQPKDLDAGKFKHDQDDMTDGGTCVDHLSTEKDPYHNGEDPGKDTQSRGSTGGGPESIATEMTDSPGYSDDTFPAGVTEATLTFEDCAVCKDTGKILDCVSWTYHRTKGSGGPGSITEPTGAAAPTQEFKDAKKKFEDNHGNGTKCPEEVAEVHKGEKNIFTGFYQYFPPFPHPNQPTQLRADLVNTSGQPVSGVQWTAFDQHGTRFLGAGTIPFIGPFDFAQAMFTVPAVMDPNEVDMVLFTADPGNAIPEYDETDNQESIPVGFNGPVLAVGDDLRAPSWSLIRTTPNPFRNRTTVSFSLPHAAVVRVRVFDSAGALVRTLHDGRLAAGAHDLDWDGRDASGRRVAAGLYLVRAEYEGRLLSGKTMLLR